MPAPTPIINYNTATPGVILIDTGNGVSKPYSSLTPVWDDTTHTLELRYGPEDLRKVLNEVVFSAVTCNIDGVAQDTSTYANLIVYITSILSKVNAAGGGGGGGGDASAANQVIGNTSLNNIDTDLGAKADASASSDSGTFSLISLFKRALGKLSSMVTSLSGVLTVGGITVQKTTTAAVTNSASAYTAGMCVGGLIGFDIVRDYLKSGIMPSFMVIENGTQKAPMDILFFSKSPAGSYTDHATFTLNSSDVAILLRKVSIAATDYVTVGGYSIADIQAIGKELFQSDVLAANKYVFAVAVTSGTPTFGSTSALTFKIGFIQD